VNIFFSLGSAAVLLHHHFCFITYHATSCMCNVSTLVSKFIVVHVDWMSLCLELWPPLFIPKVICEFGEL
jgi:hypothetical protein